MKTEIERKFLVVGDAWRAAAGAGELYEQGYISSGSEKITVRVRRAADRGFLTLKGPTEGISRSEMEYEIPAEEADFMLKNFCGGRIVSKMRYLLPFNGNTWEIDEFSGKNAGLILAEIELETEGQPFEKPAWIGEEVSHDPRYFNAALALNPFLSWEV
ncbi:MAG: CYTH domain-containing protein [Verrucomicrobia bacterium]|nr:CYTH domain-containing protein [Verrucomicrobiota bacterium]